MVHAIKIILEHFSDNKNKEPKETTKMRMIIRKSIA